MIFFILTNLASTLAKQFQKFYFMTLKNTFARKGNNSKKINVLLISSRKRILHYYFHYAETNREIVTKFFNDFINEYDNFKLSRSVIVMDNTTYHHGKEITNLFISKNSKNTLHCYRKA